MTCFAVMASAAPVVLDLSRSHSVEDLKRSELRVKEIAGGLHGQAYSFQNQEVEILLPRGRSFKQTVVLGTIDTKDGELTRLYMSGGVMPREQAVQIAHLFHQSYGLPDAKLTEWNITNQSSVRSVNGYAISPVLKSYPIVSLAIDDSINKLYPWVIRFEVEWGWKEQRDWNEERAWRELPLPAVAAISLNPPSGQKYERRDAFKETLEEQKKFEQELATKGATSIPKKIPGPTALTATPNASLALQAEPSPSTSWRWIIGTIYFLSVAGGIFLKFRRK